MSHSAVPRNLRFPVAKLLASLRPTRRAPRTAGSRYVHFVDVDRDLTADGGRVLESLLRYGPSARDGQPRGELLLVVPRSGTVFFAVVEQATDIAHVCGLGAVRRIERGVAYTSKAPAR